MLHRTGPNRGELAKAQLILQESESKLERVVVLLEERMAQRRDLETNIRETAATGDMDALIALQSRFALVEKTIAELRGAEAEGARRVESARRYLYTLYIRLEKLRQEFSVLMRRIASIDQGETIPPDVMTNIGRVKIQLKAITGENSTGRL